MLNSNKIVRKKNSGYTGLLSKFVEKIGGNIWEWDKLSVTIILGFC